MTHFGITITETMGMLFLSVVLAPLALIWFAATRKETMKTLLLALAFCLSVNAVNLRWTLDLDASSDPFGNKYDPESGWVATLTLDLYEGETIPWLTMDLSPFYLQGSAYPAGFVRDVANAGPYGIWVQDYLVHQVPYAMDPTYVDGIEGRLIGLAPQWKVGNAFTNGAHYRGEWGKAEEWNEGNGEVPEPGAYAAMFAFGLAGFAMWRRIRQ